MFKKWGHNTHLIIDFDDRKILCHKGDGVPVVNLFLRT
jgi:hypothetical protein